jgi:hypothetical protein
MTPKEKAEYLIRKYYTWGIRKEGQTLSWLESKECALIAVDEIREHASPYFIPNKDGKFVSFWQEVKQEIDKL